MGQDFEVVELTSFSEIKDYFLLFPDGVSRDEEWLFRGQACSNWTLEPSLVRYLERLEKSDPSKCKFSDNPMFVTFYSEMRLIDTFVYRCQLLGLPPAAHSYGFSALTDYERTHKILPYMARCQHYGLPTRLLDWSEDILLALYFACQMPDSDDSITSETASVWAFNRGNDIPGNGLKFSGKEFGLYVYDPEMSINPYAQSQKSRFTIIVSDEFEKNKSDVFAPLFKPKGEYVSAKCFDLFHIYQKNTRQFGALKQIKFPRSLNGEILAFLEKRFVSNYRVFPDFRGVCRSVLDDFKV